MGGAIEDMIAYVWPPPRGLKREPGGRKNPENFQYHLKWGFSIYRTYYGEDSDKNWQMLLHSLKHQTRLAFGSYEDDKDTDQDDCQRLRELFHLDVHEDPSLLGGLDVRGIREFCKSEKLKADEIVDVGHERGYKRLCKRTRPPETEGMADYVFDFVLLADEAVFKDIARGEYVVKAVSLRWEDGCSTWGWMRIPTGYLLDLWTLLMWNDDRTERALSFRGTEEELNQHVWPGDTALDDTGHSSEIRPSSLHYSNQDTYHMS
ncbi:hypothetical protein BKA59DRAFT_481171 [Fusarium tricinctum]|uniref:Uncharacterized protein n=1 Tax=Fusarium tricinctum TaxID=61284 RepID=A0A8K0WBA5_9HYPO|nr:hypothetical protein BKA59DRAFT_481171 [Fusarium tricinctum]